MSWADVVHEDFLAEVATELTCCHARCVELPTTGELVVCFATNSGVGTNDFKTMITRSADRRTWSEPVPIFPELHAQFSMAGNLSAAPDGSYLVLFGEKFPIDANNPEESFWDPELNVRVDCLRRGRTVCILPSACLSQTIVWSEYMLDLAGHEA